MLERLRRHPIPMRAELADVVVFTYAVPAERLERWLPPGLALDTLRGRGFLALALVRAKAMRPTLWPEAMGIDTMLAGYRLFVTMRDAEGRTRRGLHILRSYSDRWLIRAGGNALTHYHYRPARITIDRNDAGLDVALHTPDGQGDLRARCGLGDAALPTGTVFHDLKEARRFAGPLPYTFDHEPATDGIIMIKGERDAWQPTPVAAEVDENRFLNTLGLDDTATLASAFHVSAIPYRWTRGRLVFPTIPSTPERGPA